MDGAIAGSGLGSAVPPPAPTASEGGVCGDLLAIYGDEWAPLIEELVASSPAAASLVHGQTHWAAVARNAVMLANRTDGANAYLGLAFALLHDCARKVDGDDPQHGARAAHRLIELEPLLPRPLTERDRARLIDALIRHDCGTTSDDPVIGVCWDADRLDLGRVGVELDPTYFSTIVGETLAELALFRCAGYVSNPERRFEGKLTVYRGNAGQDPRLGLSWTLDRKTAHWYALSWLPDMGSPPDGPEPVPTVWSATVSAEGLLAYYNRLGEQEVIPEPDALEDVVVEMRLPSRDRMGDSEWIAALHSLANKPTSLE